MTRSGKRKKGLISIGPAVPEETRPLLGPSWIVEGEDPKLYEELLAEVGAAVRPQDIIDWLLIKDIVALTWEIQRSRQTRETLMRRACYDDVHSILSSILPKDEAAQLATQWCTGVKIRDKAVQEVLLERGFSLADLRVRALAVNAAELDRLDQQNERHEIRRDLLLKQIERRRSGWGNQVKRITEEIIDADYSTTPRSNSELPDSI
jgi:hypothetical protein